ncbi:zinc finger protein SHOOT GRAVITROPISM 5 [Dendrobium catenatum]|nr:zinc finger protein SHOOT GRAVITROPISM 5 [Dendrobium catenatum]
MFRIATSQLPPEEFAPPSSAENAVTHKRKRRPAGTPDPDAEVISLSPRTLLESERYVCDICNQGFQRDQNLQMHRRRHKVPWKLTVKSNLASSGAAAAAKKRVFVCPEATCLHHHPCHALGDLVGIKKHFRRKHSANRQWACARCSKAYAVHSDYKAHLKTCGTRGHSCDCGRVFSRVETFIEHQDSCTATKTREPPPPPVAPPSNHSHSTSSPTTSDDDTIPDPPPPPPPLLPFILAPPNHNKEALSLLPFLPHHPSIPVNTADLHLSIAPPASPSQQAKTAKAAADKAREEALRDVHLAERELVAARRVRQQAQAELEKACQLRTAAARQIHSILLQITCGDCRQRMLRNSAPLAGGNSFSGDDESSGHKSLRL